MAETWVPADTFGARLVAGRRALGLSVDEASEKCDLKPATWSLWERDGSVPRNMAEVVNKIEAGIGLDRNYLMWGMANIPPEVPRLSREHEAAGQDRFSGSDIDAVCAAAEQTANAMTA